MATLTGEGATLNIGGAISQVVSISFSGWSVGEVENTNLASTYKTYRQSQQPDTGTMSATIQYDPGEASHASITTLMNTPGTSLTACVVTFSDGSTYGFNGFPTAFDITNEIDAEVEADIEVKISGAITITPAV